MKLVSSSAEYIPQEDGFGGICRQIEKAGRTCYKSENKITGDSAKNFVDKLYKNNHTAMLEHGTVYLKFPYNDQPEIYAKYLEKYSMNPYSKVSENYAYITTNFRVIAENLWFGDLYYVCSPTEEHIKRYTVRCICDRGVSHELVRHRKFSFAQESTRYCNYSKNEFGNEITFIKPSWINDPRKFKHSEAYDNAYERFVSICEESEGAYFDLIDEGFTPQQARQVLPNALKTEIVMTGFAEDWKHFFNLRLFGTTGKPHPDMVILSQMIKDEFEKNGIKF